ncbi:DUF3466 family protein [Alteromonas sp. CYL-A6]|uniref:DUF3466 family protein n=1 Tax=Alteromonas nitratireducens TaxID=3390813 RepID=UPI0034BF2CFD
MKRTQLAAAMFLASGCFSAVGATYSVTPLPLTDVAQNNFARSIDNTGTMLSTVQTEYNPPVDLEQLENDTNFFTSGSYPLENEDDVKQGVFSDADYTAIFNFLIASRNQITGQQLADARTYVTDTVDARVVPGFDVISDKFDDYTRSVVTLARDSVGGDFIVGRSEGVYIVEPYENADGNIVNLTYNNLLRRAFVEVNGVTKPLPPTATTLGGLSSAYAINDNLQVAGWGTVFFKDTVDELIANCEDPEVRSDVSEGYCKAAVRANQQAFQFESVINATVWQLDSSGDVISTTTYPLVFTPEDEEGYFFSRAFDINNNGIAVGVSQTGEVVTVTLPGAAGPQRQPGQVAVVFRDAETVELLPRDENLQSEAKAINDNGWVAGYVLRAPSSIARQALFVHNLDSGETVYPQGFFTGSSVYVNSINNNNIVVGRADVESTNETDREVHAFMYDIDEDTFTNLNDLIACDSPYTLVDAVDINDNNEIIANARIERTTNYITGNPILDDAGEALRDDNIIAVKLSPLPNGQVQQCDVDEEEEGGYERQGASLSAWLLLLLGGLTIFRRFRR